MTSLSPLTLRLPQASLLRELPTPAASPARPAVPAARVGLVQYRDGVELVLGAPARPYQLPMLAAGILLPAALALLLPTEPALLLIAALCLLWTSLVLSRSSARRSLLAHGASETWLLLGESEHDVRAGGLSGELVLAVEPEASGGHRLRLFTKSGVQELGAAGRLSPPELLLLRRFSSLAGIRLVGLTS
jgi:hypothetical protein